MGMTLDVIGDEEEIAKLERWQFVIAGSDDERTVSLGATSVDMDAGANVIGRGSIGEDGKVSFALRWDKRPGDSDESLVVARDIRILVQGWANRMLSA